jgi:ABC-type dipeptide/oligopeptide/nickel transport system ATPase component
MTASDGALLRIDGLCADAVAVDGERAILRDVSLSLASGRMRGLIGETGSGKSMTAKSVMGLLPPAVRVTGGSITFADRDLTSLRERDWRAVRGPEIGMVFQNPRTALYPMASVERQMDNVLRAHRSMSRDERRERILAHLGMTGISDPARVARSYPHELSGGMAQRVVIATALILEPRMLIADEPTTGLDATVQRQILDLLRQLQQDLGIAVLMITHDLGIVAHFCDDATVMREGRVVEDGPVDQVLVAPSHVYTQQLLEASRLASIRSEAVR